MKKLSRHFPHYFSLIGIMIAGTFGIIYFSYDKNFQIAVAVSTVVSYVIWGLVHHLAHRDLYLVVVLEYISMAALGLAVILSLIYR